MTAGNGERETGNVRVARAAAFRFVSAKSNAICAGWLDNRDLHVPRSLFPVPCGAERP
jgi:hypothetical protein